MCLFVCLSVCLCVCLFAPERLAWCTRIFYLHLVNVTLLSDQRQSGKDICILRSGEKGQATKIPALHVQTAFWVKPELHVPAHIKKNALDIQLNARTMPAEKIISL